MLLGTGTAQKLVKTGAFGTSFSAIFLLAVGVHLGKPETSVSLVWAQRSGWCPPLPISAKVSPPLTVGYLRVCQMTSLMACSRWHHHEVRSCLEQVRSALQLPGTGRAGWDAPGVVRVRVTPKRSLYSSCDLESDKKHRFPQVYMMFG